MSRFPYRSRELPIEKYMGGLMIYVIVREAGHHVMCTFSFERAITY
jgi:hypothetical protein